MKVVSDSDVLRLFVAVEIPGAVRAALAAAQARLRAGDARVGWVPPENIHLTLAFLGDTFQARVPALQAALDRAVSGFASFSVEVRGLGAFGAPRSPRVIWAGLEDASGLLAGLHAALAERLTEAGVVLEARPFHAHLTLGRVRSRRGSDALTAAMASDKDTPFGALPVKQVLLMRSRLEARGAEYSILHSSPLKGAGHHGG
jgi:2'-5' RNA ligase